MCQKNSPVSISILAVLVDAAKIVRIVFVTDTKDGVAENQGSVSTSE